MKWVFVSENRNRLDIRVGIEIDLISAMGLTSTWFLCAGSKLTLFFVWGSIDLVFCVWSNLTWLLYAG